MALILIALIFFKPGIFKWLLPVSFLSDMVDGYLARRFKVKSILGAKLDSIADDLTVVAGLIGLVVLKPGLIHNEATILIILFVMYVIQTVAALIKYHKLSGFHTYTAKTAAVFQGIFLILVFLLPNIPYGLFFIAAITTAFDLIEEITLVIMLPKWEADVKGVFWVMRRRKNLRKSKHRVN